MLGLTCDNEQEEPSMTITLRPEQEKAVAQAIESGAYQNPDEVISRMSRIYGTGVQTIGTGWGSDGLSAPPTI
jgi:hypothetical protein